MVVKDGRTTYSGWYEWFPDYMRKFSSLDVSPGDTIRATVVAKSTVSGKAILENLTTGQRVQHTFRNEASLGKLCQANAEWIVEVSLPKLAMRRVSVKLMTSNYRISAWAGALFPSLTLDGYAFTTRRT